MTTQQLKDTRRGLRSAIISASENGYDLGEMPELLQKVTDELDVRFKKEEIEVRLRRILGI